jgi:hypothetical protein
VTEQQQPSIVEIEQGQAAEQADIRAAHALQLAGLEGAKEDTVRFLASQFPELQ